MTDSTAWRFCPKCGETKPRREFYNDSKKTRNACRTCANIMTRKKYASRLEFVQSYKLERGCVDCGFNGHPAALEFDHLPQFEKTHTISQLVPRMSIPHEVLLAEMAKCEVVCANCHRVRTYTRGEHGGFHDLRRSFKEADQSPAGPPPFEQLTLEV